MTVRDFLLQKRRLRISKFSGSNLRKNTLVSLNFFYRSLYTIACALTLCIKVTRECPHAFYKVRIIKSGLEKTRVFLKKPSPVGFFGFFWVFLVFFGFFGFFWAFLGFFALTRGFLGFFPVSWILLGTSRLQILIILTN